jgi:GrpB-like predicted nucleotidyltransferase (UPF0157 family)
MTLQVVEVTPYDPAWPAAFAAEAARLEKALARSRVWLEHIGSTSVPGLAAKPIIDMLLAVTSLEDLDRDAAALLEQGYLARGEFGMAGRRYFTLDTVRRTHQLHCFAIDDQVPLERHLALRDYLRTHAEEAAAYGKLKTDLARRHASDYQAYMDGKDSFIQALESSALAWRRALPAFAR